jgi:aminoglycoside phosphotransferase (APT) family kinase protein
MGGDRHGAGELIARGNTSDIWSWTAGTVVKVLRPEIPRHWASIEADITRRVHAAGFPAPATDGVVDVDGRPGVVLERVNGETMWQRMKTAPDDVRRLIEVLVDLQTDLLASSPIVGLPDLTRRLGSKIDEAVQLSSGDRAEAQAMLERSPRGTGICHGDMHPANIVMADRGPVILDWYDAAIGHPTADIVRSSLLMRPPQAKNTWLSGATTQLLDLVHSTYVAELARRHLIDAETFAPWEAVVAVARMSEPVPTGDLVEIWELWQSGGTAAAGSMIERCRARVDRQVGAG